MWTIGQLKTRGMAGFKANYWKAVLVSVIIMVVTGSLTLTVSSDLKQNNQSDDSYSSSVENGYYEYSIGRGNDFSYDFSIPEEPAFGDEYSYEMEQDDPVSELAISISNLLEGIVALLVTVFITNVFVMGADRFYYKNLSRPMEAKEIMYGFDRSYKNVVKILFLRDLYLTLWTLLFIIPGIVKYYEYLMVPYILAEHPDMNEKDAFYLSKRMMEGEKWHAFCLDLSFIGWYLLSALTLGILYVFHVGPYKLSTNAALYEALCIIKDPYNAFKANPAATSEDNSL